MKAALFLPLWQCVFASAVSERNDISFLNSFYEKFMPLLSQNNSLEDLEENIRDEYVETLATIVEITPNLPFESLKKISCLCEIENDVRDYWNGVSRSHCYEFYMTVYSSIVFDTLEEENATTEDLSKFVEFSKLLPKDGPFDFQDIRLIKVINDLFDKLDGNSDLVSQSVIKEKIKLLTSAIRSTLRSSANKIRLERCDNLQRLVHSVKNEQEMGILLDEVENVFSKSPYMVLHSMILKTVSRLYVPDENNMDKDANIYSYKSAVDPEKKILKKLEEMEKVKKDFNQMLLPKRLAFIYYLLGIKMNIYLPQFYKSCIERCQKEIDTHGPEYADALETLELLKDNAAGGNSFEKGYAQFVLFKELPDKITQKEISELSTGQKKLLFESELNFCRRMDASILLQMDPADLKNISSFCLASMRRFCGKDALDLQSIVPLLSYSSFRYAYHRLHPNTFLAMSSDQMYRFGLGQKDKIKEIVPIERLSEDQLEKLSPYVISYNMKINISIFWGKKPEALYNYLYRVSSESCFIDRHPCSHLNILEFFNRLTEPGPDGIIGYDYVQNVPVNCWKVMKGIYDEYECPAIDISSTFPYMSPLIFASVPNSVHKGTLRALTPELALYFSVKMSDYSMGQFNFDIIEKDEALNSLPNKTLLLSLVTFPDALKRLTDEKVIALTSVDVESKFLYVLLDRIKEMLSNISQEKIFEVLKKDGIKKYVALLPSDFFVSLSGKDFEDLPPQDVKLILSNMTTEQVFELKGIYQRKDSDAIDLSPYFNILPPDLFSRLTNQVIHQNTIDHMPPEFSQNFCRLDWQKCANYDLSKMSLPSMNAIIIFCLAKSIDAHKSEMSDEYLKDLMQKKHPICFAFSYEYVKTRFGMDVLSSLPYSCLSELENFWNNISEVGPHLPPEFFQKAEFPPQKKFIDCNDRAAANWALENPDVCKYINEDFPLPYVLRLPVACQVVFFAEMPENLAKVGLDSINEDVFKGIIKLENFHGKSWAEIIDIPINLRKHVTPNVIATLKDLGNIYVQEVNLEEFPNDIFSLIRRPLPQAILKNLDPRFLTYRLCLFHFENELPSGVENIKGCSEKLGFIDRTFKRNHLQFWEKELWSGLEYLLSPYDLPLSVENFEKYEDFDKKLSRILGESENEVEFYEYLHEAISTFDPMEDLIRFNKITFVKDVNYKVIYNLLITSPSHVVRSIEKYSFIPSRDMEFEEFDLRNHTFRDGAIFPKHLFDNTVAKAVNFAKKHTLIELPSGSDAGALSRVFVDQCVDFIFDGPNKQAYEAETNEISKEGWLKPLLTSIDGQTLFFPFRAHRDIGTFVAYTIVKGLQSSGMPCVVFGRRFYQMLAIAKPEVLEDGIEGLTTEERDILNNYHDHMFSGTVSLRELLPVFQMEYNWYGEDSAFPRLDVFHTPFGPPVSYLSEAKESPSCKPIDIDLNEYLNEYRESTYAEFRALMWNFKKVFIQAFDLYRLSHLWNLDLWNEVMGSRQLDLTADKVYYGMKKMNDQNVTHIDSLVRNIKTGVVATIDFYDAVKMFLDRLNNQQLGGFVAMFTGTPRYTIKANYFYFSFKDLAGDEYPVDGDAVFMNSKIVLKRNVLEDIIKDIYEEQIKMFRVDPSECEMVKSVKFPPSHAQACFGTVDVARGINNFQLIYLLTQQINAPLNVLID